MNASVTLTVERRDVRRGDWLHLGKDLWAEVDQHGHGPDSSFVWLRGIYYPVTLDSSSLATVRRKVGQASRETPTGRQS